ncbi:O-antigen ligase family protein [Pseudomonas sp. HLS-6 TE3448]
MMSDRVVTGRLDVFLGFLFAIFVPVLDGWYLMWGHVFFIFWVFFSFVAKKITSQALLLFGFVFLLFVINFFVGVLGSEGHRFVQDSLKFFMLIFSVFVISQTCPRDDIVRILKGYCIFFPVCFLIFFLFFKEGDWFSYSGRMYDPLFGSPNVLGVFCSLAIVFLLRFKREMPFFVFLLLVGFYGVVLLMGFSRAAIISLLFSLFFLVRKKLSLLFFLSLILTAFLVIFAVSDVAVPDWVYTKSNIVEDVQATGGSNRLMIWRMAIEMIVKDPMALFFGGGVGRVITTLEYGGVVDHPHNFYLFIAWGYGFFGFVIFILSWFYAFLLALKASSRDADSFSIALLVFYSLAFCMDTHLLAGQYFVPHVFFLAMLFLPRNDVSSRMAV